MNQPSLNSTLPTRSTAYLYFLFALLLLTLLGFAGYYFGFLGFIYNVMMPARLEEFPFILLPIIFGMAAFFSPCSFTVLPAYVSHYLAGDSGRIQQPLRAGIYFGSIAAVGVITINILVGLAIAALGSAAPFAKDPREDVAIILGIRIIAGLLVTIMGILAVLDRPLPIPSLQRFIGKSTFGKSIFFYGLLYNGAAIGCTGPILLGLILYALTTGSFTSALVTFIIFALTMGILMILLTSAVAVFKEGVMQTFIPFVAVIRKAAGWVMIITGLYIAALTLEGNRIFVNIFFPFLK